MPQATISTWQQQIDDIEALKETELIVHQGADPTGNIDQLSTQVRSGILEDLYIKNQELIEDKDEKIALLEKEISRYRGDGFSFSDLSQEAKINYDGIDELGYSNLITTNFSKTDTIPTFTVGWKDNLNNRQITEQKQRFEKWLKVRLKLDTLQVKSVN